MARRTFYDSRSGTFKTTKARRKRRRGGTRGIGVGALGQGLTNVKSVKGTLKGLQGVLLTGAIAAGGAIMAQAVYERLGEQQAKLTLKGWQRQAAVLATGLGIAILVAKYAKKPRIAAALAIGPVVSVAMTVFADILAERNGVPPLPASGFGLTTIQPSWPAIPQNASGAFGDVVQYGGQNPWGVEFPGRVPRSYATQGVYA